MIFTVHQMNKLKPAGKFGKALQMQKYSDINVKMYIVVESSYIGYTSFVFVTQVKSVQNLEIV